MAKTDIYEVTIIEEFIDGVNENVWIDGVIWSWLIFNLFFNLFDLIKVN